MIDVTKDIGGGVHIDLTNGEADALLEALDFYLNDMDANERKYAFEDVRDLRDRLKEEAQ